MSEGRRESHKQLFLNMAANMANDRKVLIFGGSSGMGKAGAKAVVAAVCNTTNATLLVSIIFLFIVFFHDSTGTPTILQLYLSLAGLVI